MEVKRHDPSPEDLLKEVKEEVEVFEKISIDMHQA